MKQLYIKLKSFFTTIQGKIAFYPTLLSLAGFILAFLMMALEENGISQTLLEHTPQIMLEDGDTALTVLSVCIGGLISMMVFSFSMVMLLLSQASSNFSPRLLPGLISDKKNQVILGTYLATILYLMFTLFAVEPDDQKYTLPGLSILFGIACTFVCLGAFIYFIHNMSQSIQINNILDDIFYKSKTRLERIILEEAQCRSNLNQEFGNSENWHSYTSSKSGYYQNISIQNILDICTAQDIKIHIAIPKGLFALQHIPLIKSNKPLKEEVVQKLLSNLNFSRGEFVEDNYILAFKQITEIAVKAMSPGINDPGTASNAIDYLTELLAMRMKKRDTSIIQKGASSLLKLEIVSFKTLLYNMMASLRSYCKSDPIIVQKLLYMLGYLHKLKAADDNYFQCIEDEINLLMEDAKSALTNSKDFEQLTNISVKVSYNKFEKS